MYLRAIEKLLIACFYKNEVIGYAIFSHDISDYKKSMLDLWFEKDPVIIIKKITLKAIQFARENKIKRIIYPHFNPNLDKLFFSVSPFSSTMVTKMYHKSGYDIKYNKDNSYFSLILGDYGF